MPLGQVAEKNLHDGFLMLAAQMEARHGARVWSFMAQGMQSAYYMGAIAALSSSIPKAKIFRQAEDGLGDALNIPNMRIVDNEAAPAKTAV